MSFQSKCTSQHRESLFSVVNNYFGTIYETVHFLACRSLRRKLGANSSIEPEAAASCGLGQADGSAVQVELMSCALAPGLVTA